MIQLGADKHKETLKEMWKRCFPNDTDSFIRYYFDEVYKNEETLIYIENEKPVASLQMIPYRLKIGSEISLAGYISGAMTHPDFQKQGYMTKLLNASFEVMKERGYDYTFLIPQEEWLFGYYERFGYSLTSGFSPQEKEVAGACELTAPLGSEEWSYEIYSQFLSSKTNAVLKSASQFENILWDFFDERGVLITNKDGIAFVMRQKGQIVLKEFFYRDEEVKEELLGIIRDYYARPEATITPPAESKGMIKPLNDSKKTINGIYFGMMLD
jgi:GNAT superfamily N-acetyltransferase